MKKLYLLIDEWNNDKNFVGKELEIICRFFDVTVICNSTGSHPDSDINYFIYERPSKIHAFKNIVKLILDPDIYSEIKHIEKDCINTHINTFFSKTCEMLRFYLNSCFFYDFMKNNNLIEDNAIYYSYWFFWKCYAMTHNRKKYPNSRIITRTHEYDLYDYTIASGYQPFKLSMDKGLDKIVFIADHGRDYYLNKYTKQLSDKYLLYYLGTDDPKSQNTISRDFSNTLSLVSCSSVIPRKRVAYIIEALSLIDNININWIHFGDGELMDELKALANNKLNDKSNIEYTLAGYTKNEDILNYYCNNYVTAFITTTSSEGNPVSVMEAMSYGIPVIATGVCNIPDMIKDCGVIMSDNPSYEEIKKAVESFCNISVEDMIKLRETVYKTWYKKFRGCVNNEKFVSEVLFKL